MIEVVGRVELSMRTRLYRIIAYVALVSFSPWIEAWSVYGNTLFSFSNLQYFGYTAIVTGTIGIGYYYRWNWAPWLHLVVWLCWLSVGTSNTQWVVHNWPGELFLAPFLHALLSYVGPALVQVHLFRQCREKFNWYAKGQKWYVTSLKLAAALLVVGCLSLFVYVSVFAYRLSLSRWGLEYID